jgi:hypothetical protein
MGPESRVTFIYAVHVGHITLADHGWRTNPPWAREPAVDVCHVDGGRSRISVRTPRGLAVDVYHVDGGRSRISIRTSQGAHGRHFLTLMMDAIGSLAPAPRRGGGPPSMFSNVHGGRPWILWQHLPEGPPSTFFNVDGGRSRISVSTHQGVCHRYFLALTVDAPRSSALAPSRCTLSTFLSIDDRCYRISSSSTSQGTRHQCFFNVDGRRSQISISTRQGAPSTFLSVDGGCSRISSFGTSQGYVVDLS